MRAAGRIPLPLVLAAGVAAVSSASILIKFARLEGVPPLVIAAWRLTLASLVLAPLAWRSSRQEIRALTRGELLLAFISGLFLAVHFVFWISSFDYTSIMSSVVFVATNPLFVAVASMILLKEAISGATWQGILVAGIGGVVIGAADLGAGQSSLSGDLLALAAAAAASAYVLIGRRLRARLSLLVYIAIVYGVAAAILLVLALLTRAPLFGYSTSGYIILVLIAVVPQLIGHTAFNYALKYLSAALVAVILLAEPVGATLLAIPLFGEIPSAYKLIGGALVLAGIFVATRGGDRAAEQAGTEIEATTLE